jgi:agmatinase
VTSIQVPIIPFDNVLAMDQMQVAYSTLLDRPMASNQSVWAKGAQLAKDGREHPRIVRFVLFTTC